MADRNAQEVRFPGFPDGVNNVDREHEMRTPRGADGSESDVPPTAARALKNVDIMARGRVKRRRGYAQVVATTESRGLTSYNGDLYFADGGVFYRCLLPDETVEAVHDVAPGSEISSEEINGVLYVTDGGTNAFRVHADGSTTEWSVEQPSGQPSLAAVALGTLPAGEYQVAVTFLRGREESGTTRAARVTLSEEGSIQLSNIPQPTSPETTGIRVYLSRTSSERLYQQRDLGVGTTDALFSLLPTGKQLDTQFLEPMPRGHIVRQFKGRMLTAIGSTLVFSEALRFGLTNLSHNFIQFHGPITMVRPVEGGVFVAAGVESKRRTVFLQGTDPNEFTMRTVYTHGAVPGTDLAISSTLLADDRVAAGETAVWWATNGVMVVGTPSGEVLPLREGELALPEFSRGAMLVRSQDGVRQLVSTLSNPQAENPLAVTDSISIEVHKNGIST